MNKSFADKPGHKPFLQRHNEIRRYLAIFALIIGAVILSSIVSMNASLNREQRKKIITRFKEADPNANIQVDAYHIQNDFMDPFSGSSITLFRSDKRTMNTFISKWKLRREEGLRSVDSGTKFSVWEWVYEPYRTFHNKDVPYYSCGYDIFPVMFGTTLLLWDAETGTGCFYQYWSD